MSYSKINEACKRKKIALDVDGTLADVGSLWIQGYNKLKGTSYDVNDMLDWNHESIGSNISEMHDLYIKIWKDHYNGIKFEGDICRIKELCRHYEVDIVTSREYDTAYELGIWLEKNGLSWLPVVINNPNKDKSLLDYDLYIDDSPILAENIDKNKSKLLYIVNRPWNRNVEETGNIIRVEGVNEALDMLIEKSAAMDLEIANE